MSAVPARPPVRPMGAGAERDRVEHIGTSSYLPSDAFGSP